MSIDADRVAAAVGLAMRLLVELRGEGWYRSVEGASVALTGVPISMFNGVWALDEIAPESVDSLLDDVADAGVPYSLQARDDSLAAVAERRGMVREADIPIMAHDESDWFPRTTEVVRELTVDEGDTHVRVAAEGYEVPVELFRQLMTPAALSADEVRTYIAEIDGRAVATGLGLRTADHVGVFDIATVPAYRRRGLGSAVTARVVQDGFASGASFAWLQSSEDGYPVYDRLGFQTVERWQWWTAQPR